MTPDAPAHPCGGIFSIRSRAGAYAWPLRLGTVLDVLAHLLLHDPHTPTAAVAAAAVSSDSRRHLGAAIAHPNLPDDHPLLTSPQEGTVLSALRSPLATPARRRHLWAALPPATRSNFLGGLRNATPDDVHIVHDLDTRARGRMTAALARTLVPHHATPPALRLDAVRVVLGRGHPKADDVERALSASTRLLPTYLPVLADECRNVDVRARLQRYAASADPHEAFVADVVAAIDGSPAQWVVAAHRSLDPTIAAAAAAAHPVDTELLRALLASHRLTPALAEVARVAASYPNEQGRSMVMNALAGALADAPEDLVIVQANAARHSHQLPKVPHDPTADTLEQLITAGLDHVDRDAHVIDFLAQCALKPHATPAQRARVSRATLDFGCSPAADISRWLRIPPVLKALDDVDRLGFAAAALQVPADIALREPKHARPQCGTFAALTTQALREHHEHLHDPNVTSMLLALALTFDGTLEQLISSAVDACA